MSQGPQLSKDMAAQLMVLQEKLLAAQEELKNETVSATAGGGAIQLTVTGDQRCTEVKIDPDYFKDSDAKALEEMIMVAMNKALDESRDLAANRLSPYAPNLG